MLEMFVLLRMINNKKRKFKNVAPENNRKISHRDAKFYEMINRSRYSPIKKD